MYPYGNYMFLPKDVEAFWEKPTPFQQELRTLTIGQASVAFTEYEMTNPYFHTWPPKTIFPNLTVVNGLALTEGLIFRVIRILSDQLPYDHAWTIPDCEVTINCRPEIEHPGFFNEAWKFIHDWPDPSIELQLPEPDSRVHRMVLRYRIRKLRDQVAIQQETTKENNWIITITCQSCSPTSRHSIRITSQRKPTRWN